MPDIRDMELLSALARHNHFARAAKECGISQPAFSNRIRNLEIELEVPIVKRGNRFMGFTPEGETVLKWARRILADAEAMRQDVKLSLGALSGRLFLGAVPTALAYAAHIPARLRGAHPDLILRLRSMTSVEIHRALDDQSIDAGLTYLDEDLPPHLSVLPLYSERYVLLVPEGLAQPSQSHATWAEAMELPLCLLTDDMRNRRILNEVFLSATGRKPAPVMETNGFTAMLAQVSSGVAATIAPALLVESLALAPGTLKFDLKEPEITTSIGLVTTDTDPVPPAVRALLNVLGTDPQ